MNQRSASVVCSLAPQIVLRGLGPAQPRSKVDVRFSRTEDRADDDRANPTPELPTGEHLAEVAVPLQVRAARAPAPEAAPAHVRTECYLLQEWFGFNGTEIDKIFVPLWKPDCTDDEEQRTPIRPAFRLDGPADGLGSREHLQGSFSIAGAYRFAVPNWRTWIGVDLTQWPALKDEVARVSARPKLAQALRA